MRRSSLLVLPLAVALAAAALALGGDQRAAGAGARWITAPIDRGPLVASVPATARVLPDDGSGRLALLIDAATADAVRVRRGQRLELGGGAAPRGAAVLEIGPAGTLGGLVLLVGLPSGSDAPAPGATVGLRFLTERRDNALRVPDAALNWRPAGAPEPPPAVRAPGAGSVADLLDLVGRELAWDAAKLAAAGEAARAAERAAYADLPADADPAVRRERFKTMRRALRDRLSEFAGPDDRARVHEFVAAWSETRRREGARAALLHVVDADGRPQPVPVRIGIGDGRMTELLGVPLEPGAAVVVGERLGPGRSGPWAWLGF